MVDVPGAHKPLVKEAEGQGRPSVAARSAEVRIQLLSATLVAAVLAVASPSFAQNQAAPARSSTKFGVAVIDIAKIFKEHVRFKQQMDQLRKQVEGVEEGLKQERDFINNLIEQQKQFATGSQDYKNMDDQILKRQADFNLSAAKNKKELVDKQDKLYFQVYEEINQMVKGYCEHFGVSIVLRNSNEVPDPNDHQAVLRAINKPIVYLAPGMDITQDILTELNRGASATAPVAPTGPRQTGLSRPTTQQR